MNIKQVLQQANRDLLKSSPSAMLDAQVLLTHILRCNTAHLVAWPEKELNKTQESDYLSLIQQRLTGIPVAHLTGRREFWSLDFSVDNSTLIPRPETETLVDYILTKFRDETDLTLLDMGTGTGAIAIAIANEKPTWKIIASDVSPPALELAKANNDYHQIANVTLIKSDWFENIPTDSFNIIVSNPPYVASDDPHLRQGDVRFEPQSALTSGKDGLDDIEHLCAHAGDHLKNNGCLIVEHGYNQAQRVTDCFAKNGFTELEQRLDLSGHTRMTAGKI